MSHFIFFNFYTFIDFFERETETATDIDVREKHQLVATHTRPDQGPNPQPTYVS